jgi:SAM-dependent methyltransferase
MDAGEWDARYGGAALVWGAEPNQFVAAELADAAPGRALDIACGEGRNAIWLAGRGWSALGVDFSATAIGRARQLAEQAGVGGRTEFLVSDVVSGPLPEGPFDGVVVAYLQLPATERTRVLRRAAERVAPGGRLPSSGTTAPTSPTA